MVLQLDTTPLPDLLAQLRFARVARFRLGELEIVFADVDVPTSVTAPALARPPTPAAPVTDPEKAPIHPLDALLDAPQFSVPRPE